MCRELPLWVEPVMLWPQEASWATSSNSGFTGHPVVAWPTWRGWGWSLGQSWLAADYRLWELFLLWKMLGKMQKHENHMKIQSSYVLTRSHVISISFNLHTCGWNLHSWCRAPISSSSAPFFSMTAWNTMGVLENLGAPFHHPKAHRFPQFKRITIHPYYNYTHLHMFFIFYYLYRYIQIYDFGVTHFRISEFLVKSPSQGRAVSFLQWFR